MVNLITTKANQEINVQDVGKFWKESVYRENCPQVNENKIQ